MGMTESEIAIAGNLAGQGINAISQGSINRKTREYNTKMYNLQRAHALEDRDWLANYNSPSEQMARFKAAGLNPNLIYGNASNDAPAIRSSQAGSWNPEAPKFDPGSAIAAYQNTEIRKAQTDNLKVQNEKLQEEINYIKANTLNVIEQGKGRSFDNLLNSELRNNAVEMRDALLQKMRADIDMSIHGNRRQDALNDAQITNMKDGLKTSMIQRLEAIARTKNLGVQNSKLYEEIKAIKSGTYNSTIDGAIKDLELERQKRGGSVSDPWFIKRFDAIAEKFLGKWKTRK